MEPLDIRYGIIIAAIEAGHELDQIVPFAARASAFVVDEQQIGKFVRTGPRVVFDEPAAQPDPESAQPLSDAPEPAPEQETAAPARDAEAEREGLPYRLYRVLMAAREGGDATAIAARLGLRQGSVKIYLGELRAMGKLPQAELAEAGRALSALKPRAAPREPIQAAPAAPPPPVNAQAIPLLPGISVEDSQIVYLRRAGWNPLNLAGRFSMTVHEMNQRLRGLERAGHLPEMGQE